MALRDALRLILGDRGLDLAPDQDAAIDACTDRDRLRHWLRLAISASSASAVIDGAGH